MLAKVGGTVGRSPSGACSRPFLGLADRLPEHRRQL